MHRSLDLLQLVTLGTFLALFVGRTLQLHRRGIQVLTLLRGKSWRESALEAIFLVAFPLWIFDVAWYAWPWAAGSPPAAIDVVLFEAGAARAIGVALQLGAVVLFAASLHSFGDSWRVGVDHRAPGSLVTTGTFAFSRNPIFLSMDLFVLGTVLLTGRLIPALVAAGAVVGFHQQIRNEEQYLAAHYGAEYQAYCARVRRYLGRIRVAQPEVGA